MRNSEPKPDVLPQRLCSEIQLFDLCDLDSCGYKNGRFCTDPALLDSFEKIAEEELRAPERSLVEEIDNAEVDDSDGDGYDDEAAMEDFDSVEDDGCEDEE
jgi:hypothetical protein